MRELLSLDMALAKAEIAGDGRTLKGYATAYDHPVLPEATGLPFTTLLKRGVFAQTIKTDLPSVQVLLNHGLDPSVGEKPLGKITKLEEHPYGLWAEVRLSDTSYNADIRELLADGALKSMSVAFTAQQWDMSDDGTERHLRQARLWEFGPVTFPANGGASASLHSVAGFAREAAEASMARAGVASSEDHQAGAADEASLTWTINANMALERHLHSQAALEARIARLQGRH